jgi:prepilin-type N-terminal cleavage/methylation domain-containing protein
MGGKKRESHDDTGQAVKRQGLYNRPREARNRTMDIKRFFRGNKKGLTLIELVIALAVASAVSGGLVLSLRAADRLALQNASYAVQADLRYAQRMAMLEGRRWGIIFDIDGDRYHIFTFNETGGRLTEKTVPMPNGVRTVDVDNLQRRPAYCQLPAPRRPFHGLQRDAVEGAVLAAAFGGAQRGPRKAQRNDLRAGKYSPV